MNDEKLLKVFRETGAHLTGHFQLSSGLHSNVYFQSALVLQDPDSAEVCGRALAAQLRFLEPRAVVGPALGGIIIGWEVARALDVRGLFTERRGGVMGLRRGFRLAPGERVVVVEDVVTTGKSIRETVAAIGEAGGEVVGAGAIVDRSDGSVNFDVPFRALLELPARSWKPEECPQCEQGVPVRKPGSRPLESKPTPK